MLKQLGLRVLCKASAMLFKATATFHPEKIRVLDSTQGLPGGRIEDFVGLSQTQLWMERVGCTPALRTPIVAGSCFAMRRAPLQFARYAGSQTPPRTTKSPLATTYSARSAAGIFR